MNTGWIRRLLIQKTTKKSPAFLFQASPYLRGLSFTTLGKALSLLIGSFTTCAMLSMSRISSGIRPGDAPCNVINIRITIPHDSERLS